MAVRCGESQNIEITVVRLAAPAQNGFELRRAEPPFRTPGRHGRRRGALSRVELAGGEPATSSMRSYRRSLVFLSNRFPRSLAGDGA